MEIGKPRPLAFSLRAFNPFTRDIDADAAGFGMSFGVGREKMAMTAAEFPHKFRGGPQNPLQFRGQRRAALG